MSERRKKFTLPSEGEVMRRLFPKREWRDGEPCGHPGCLHHVSHPCDGCGRIAGRAVSPEPQKNDTNG